MSAEYQKALEHVRQYPRDEQEQIYVSLRAMRDRQDADRQREVAALDTLYARDPFRWMVEQVYTQDETTGQMLRWPDKPYLEDTVEALQTERLLCFPKSRRMTVTWCVAAWCVHRARFSPYQAIYIQSESENKAAFVVDERCKFIEDHLDRSILRRPYEAQVGRMRYTGTRSYIEAIAQGGSKIRTFTPSVLVMDEADFQPEAHDALAAATAAAEKDVRLILISTSNGPSGVVAEIAASVGFRRFT